MTKREEWLIYRASYYTGCEIEDMFIRKKSTPIVFARYIVWYNLMHHSNYTLEKAGALFGKNHATVLNGLRKYGYRKDTEVDFKEFADDLERQYQNIFPRISRSNTEGISRNKIQKQLLSNQIFKSLHKSKYAIGKLLIR